MLIKTNFNLEEFCIENEAFESIKFKGSKSSSKRKCFIQEEGD